MRQEPEDSDFYFIDASVPEFMMMLTGAEEHWMFVTSGGGLSAGRRDSSWALFPYETVDKLMNSAAGPRTLIRVDDDELLWEPFAREAVNGPGVSRRVGKNLEGSRIAFEETELGRKLRFSYDWAFSARFGFVRRVRLTNAGLRSRRIRVLDGLQDILSPGIDPKVQSELSYLSDAYKDNVYYPDSGLAVFSLSAIITDKAEPAEALRSSVAWFLSPRPVSVSLDRKARQAFARKEEMPVDHRARGRKGDFFGVLDFELESGATETWYLVADTGLDAAGVEELTGTLRNAKGLAFGAGLAAEIEKDVEDNRLHLRSLIASSDGLSASALTTHARHHFSNVLFNVLRGGVPAEAYWVDADDVLDFIRKRNRAAATVAENLLKAHLSKTTPVVGSSDTAGPTPRGLLVDELRALAAGSGDPDLVRLCDEYLPLSYGRRHGDPSRPWNKFSIRVRGPDGKPLRSYQGNWRDIFQNWEALALSFPGYQRSFLASFLNATTLDGYNPYRVGREGLDWEKPEPDNPWSNIGYWNDHQIVYLLRLCEECHAFQPGYLESQLAGGHFTYARVPYRIASFDGILRDPRSTISFDARLDRDIEERIPREGSDARLVHDAEGSVYHGNLAEKILSLVLAKLANLVPGGGVWLNTQRPEWNDANNALVGIGLSVVTLAQLRRFIVFWRARFDAALASGVRTATVAGEVLDFARSLSAEIADPESLLAVHDPRKRRRTMERFGRAFEAYRTRVYENFRFEAQAASVDLSWLSGFFVQALTLVDASLEVQRRPDGLFHSYNALSYDSETASVGELELMLEGNVAILGSGFLSPHEASELLSALRKSALYRPDQRSYLLHPRKDLPDFLGKNTFPLLRAREIGLLAALIDSGDRRLVSAADTAHFASSLGNGKVLRAVLGELEAEERYAALVVRDRAAVENLYEEVFGHARYLGRSGTMYAFEGIGSIYWHMVAKLLLAAQENLREAQREAAGPASGADARLHAADVEALRASYLDIRDGLGYRKSAADYGAFPWDPYSHSPEGGFARQPGMTGQVKEEIITRLYECGLVVEDGRIRFEMAPLMSEEVFPHAGVFPAQDTRGKAVEIPVRVGAFGFSFCGLPIVRGIEEPARIVLHRFDGGEESLDDGDADLDGGRLDYGLSRAVFERKSGIAWMELF